MGPAHGLFSVWTCCEVQPISRDPLSSAVLHPMPLYFTSLFSPFLFNESFSHFKASLFSPPFSVLLSSVSFLTSISCSPSPLLYCDTQRDKCIYVNVYVIVELAAHFLKAQPHKNRSSIMMNRSDQMCELCL